MLEATYKSAHDKLVELGLTLNFTKNYGGGIFSHEWRNTDADRIIVVFVGEKTVTMYECDFDIVKIIPQYIEELEK